MGSSPEVLLFLQDYELQIPGGFKPPPGSKVYVPGITDMIHIIPKAKISEEEMKAHRAALRRREPSPLSERQLEELARRREVYLRIKQSVTPEYVKSIGKFMNWMDDAGDAMTTAYWGGKGASKVFEKVTGKSASKIVPFLGWALVAKDIFDVVSIFKLARSIRGQAKGDRWKDIETNPFGKKARVGRARRLRKGRPSLSDYIEILQTTDMLFGVGISFGPAVGFALDLFFGAMFGIPVAKSWKEYKSPLDQAVEGFAGGCFSCGF